VKKLYLPLPLILLGLALGLVACGGGEGDDAKIISAIETAATSTDPAVCGETQTLHFMEQTTGTKGKGAEESCEQEARSGEGNPDSVDVSAVESSDGKATANVKFEGGNLDAQTLEVSLVEDGGSWKLDDLTGFADFDAAALIKDLREQLEEQNSVEAKVVSCIVAGVEGFPDEKLEALVLEDDQQPFLELAESCE
jgi:ABC-type glycerol-3-phosphate transport system substrate-binding protein